MQVEFRTLFSGSSGNCVYIKLGDDEILIDAGKSASCIMKKLNEIGSDISRISAIFITHEHSDHISALKVLLKKTNAPVFAPEGCIGKMKDYSQRINFFELPASFQIGGCCVTPFPVPHDSDECVGYVVSGGGCHIGVATDSGYVTESMLKSLGGCRFALIEANYDEDMLKCGGYSRALKGRILSDCGHLCNRESAALVSALRRTGSLMVALGHLSAENNTPELVSQCVEKELEKYSLHGGYVVASRDEITLIAREDI